MATRHLALLAALAVLSGCADKYGGREEIKGTVTYKGNPVPDGVIKFEAMDGQGSGDGAHISNGGYTIPREKGLTPGKYKVSIYIGDGYEGTGDASPDAPAKRTGGGKPGVERAPPEFNTKSTLVREVKKGESNTFDFAIP